MKYAVHAVLLLTCLTCAAAEKPRTGPSKHDLQLARKSFDHALALRKQGQIEEALQELTTAASLAPANMEYVTARELLRGQIAATYIDRGNLLADVGNNERAAEQFRAALSFDPESGYAQQRLRDVAPVIVDDPEKQHVLQLLASVDEIEVTPKPGKQSFHVHADSRALYDTIGKTFGVIMSYDQGMANRRIHFDVDDIDFYKAMELAGKVTKSFWAPVSDKMVIVAEDTQEMRRQYQRMSLQTYYVSDIVVPTDLNDLVNTMRTVFDVRFTAIQQSKNIISVRAPRENLRIINQVLDSLVEARPEILLEIKAYELNYDKLRQQGLNLPTSFTIFNVFSEIRRVLGSGAQPVIDQLKQTGVIDPSKIPVGSLSNLQGSPLLQPFIFFGKGLGLTGVTVSPISGHLGFSSSVSKTLEHITVRAASGAPASMTIGTRYPIQTSVFSNLTISQSGNPVANSSIPQFQYEDLGIILKATPHLQTGDNVNLELDLQIKGLGAQSFNGVPVITNRAYKSSITVKDGEPSVVAGSVTEQETRSTSGYPGVGQIPLLSSILNTNSKEHSRSEILIVVTPHILRKPFKHLSPNQIWTLQ